MKNGKTAKITKVKNGYIIYLYSETEQGFPEIYLADNVKGAEAYLENWFA